MTGPTSPAVHFLPVLMGVAGYLALHHLWIWLGRRSEPVYLWVAAWSTTSLLYLASHYIQVAYDRPEPAVLGGRLAWTSAIALIFVMIGLSHALAGVRPSRRIMGTVAAGCAGLLLVLWLTEAFVTGRAYARTDLLGYGSLAPVPGPFMPMLAPLVLLVFVYAWQTLGRGQMDPRERRVIQVAFIVYGLFALNDVLHAARVIQSIRVFDYAFVAVGMGLTYMLVGRYTRLYDHLEEEVVARTTALTDQQRATATLATLTQSLTATLSLEEVLDRIVRAAVELFGSSVSRLWLVEEGGDGLLLRAHAGAIPDVIGITRLQVGEGLVGRIVATRSPLVVRDLRDDSRSLNLARLRAEGMVSFAGVPLMLGSQILGALGIATPTPRDFGEEDLSLLQSLATHAAIAIENARLHEEIHQRLRESETLLNVSQALAETADLTETVRRVARETARALGADMVGMYLVDRQEFVLRPIAGYHIPRDLLAVFMQFPFPLKGHRAIEEARDTGQPVWTSDAETDPRVDRESWKRFPHRSSVFVPMGSGEGLLGGIFAVWWEQRREPTPDDLRLALALGRHATAIIEKARLHEALGRRLDRVQTLTRLNRVLSSSLERDRVLAEIARAAAQLMDVPAASFWLADEVAGRLDLVGFSDPAVEADFPTRSIGFDQGVIGWVATHRRSLNIPDAFADGRFVALDWWRAHGLKSFYGVPVVHEGWRPAELALAQVKQLQGMLPICAYCKKIRDDSNYWQTVEAYIGERSEATFSHGICPECKEKIVKPEMERWRREQGEQS